jgi:hypothetical protein
MSDEYEEAERMRYEGDREAAIRSVLSCFRADKVYGQRFNMIVGGGGRKNSFIGLTM